MSRWIIFFAVVLCIFGSLHLYLLIKVRRAFYLESWNYFLIVAALLFLMLSPIQARILESQHQDIAALIMTWIAYLWIGALFIWLWLSLILDVYHLAVMLFQRLFYTDWIHLMLSRRQSLNLTILVTFGLMVYGAYAAQHIRTEHITIHSDKFAVSAKGVRVVQISDLHLGEVIFPGRLDRMISAVQAADPDIVVCTGDMVDGHIYDADSVIQKFQSLKPPLGKFAVTGNHEVYAGLAYSEEIIRSSGFKLLRNASTKVTEDLFLIGVDDPAVTDGVPVEEGPLFAALPNKRFHLFLKHQPTLEPSSAGRFDLQLSGHTHKGQIFPFSLVVKYAYPMFSGMYAVGRGERIYVSRGTGTWGPPIRLGAPPEVTIFDLLPAADQKIRPVPPDTPPTPLDKKPAAKR